MEKWMIALCALAAVVVALCVLRAAVRSTRPLATLWRSACGGLFSLVGVHLAGAFTGIGVGFGWFTGGIAIVMGVPGVVMLLIGNILMR